MEVKPEEKYDSGKARYKKGDVLLAKVRVREVVDSVERGVEYVVEGLNEREEHIYIGRVPEGDVLEVVGE